MKATSLIPTSFVQHLGVVAAAAALLVSAGALAPDAQAGITFTGGSASVDPLCHVNIGGNTTGLYATNYSDRQIHFVIYIENRTYPYLSGWQGWRVLQPRSAGDYASSWDYGELVPRGTGIVRAYVHYALWNGSAWETFGEWTPFQTRLGYRSDLCGV